MPAALLGLSYLTLNGTPLFVELHMAAGLALVFLAVLRLWNNRRRDYWCGPVPVDGPLLLWPWHGKSSWSEQVIDRTLDVLQSKAPDCRLIALDAYVAWPGKLRWPELSRYAAVVGPADSVRAIGRPLEHALRAFDHSSGALVALPAPVTRDQMASAALQAWGQLSRTEVTTPAPSSSNPTESSP
jgi:hypothetical protein